MLQLRIRHDIVEHYFVEHLKSARVRKQEKREYQELQSEFDRLGIPCSYDTIELSVLGHYLPDSLAAFLKCVNFIQDEVKISKSTCRRIFDLAAKYLFHLQEEFSWPETVLSGLETLERCLFIYYLFYYTGQTAQLICAQEKKLQKLQKLVGV